MTMQSLSVDNPPRGVDELLKLPRLSWSKYLRNLKDEQIEQICFITSHEESMDIREQVSMQGIEHASFCSSSTMDESVLDQTKALRFGLQSWATLEATSPFYEFLREYEDVFPEHVPNELPVDKGVRHEIDLVPGTSTASRDRVQAIDDFFAGLLKAGHVRESTSPHSSPTFCVKKATGGWRIVHAFNLLYATTVPAQTPIPRKDVIIDGMC